jgi:hypothetical protein
MVNYLINEIFKWSKFSLVLRIALESSQARSLL